MLCLCKIYNKKCLVQHVLSKKSTQPEPVLAPTEHACPVPQARFWAGISSCHPAANCHNLATLHNTTPCPGSRARRCHGASELLTFPHENEDFWILYLSGPGGHAGNLERGDWGGLAAFPPCWQTCCSHLKSPSLGGKSLLLLGRAAPFSKVLGCT